MRFQLLILITLICFAPVMPVEAQDHLTDLYLVKETVEITTDWTDISWDASILVYASTYNVLEGEDAITGMQVNGLDLWVAKEGFDATKVVVEIEAIISKVPTTVSLRVEKGDIESTNIKLSAMDENSEYRWMVSKSYAGNKICHRWGYDRCRYSRQESSY